MDLRFIFKMIQITQKQEEWRIKIEEEWSFNSLAELELVLRELLGYKGNHGRLKENDKK